MLKAIQQKCVIQSPQDTEMKECCETLCFLIKPSLVYRARIRMEGWAGVSHTHAGLFSKIPDI